MASHLLIADDHLLVRDVIAAYLASKGGYTVATAPDLHEALRLIRQQGPFDLVLLDLNMPGMSVPAGLKQAQDANGGKPVAIISGGQQRADVKSILDAGAAGFLPKTIPAGSLLNAVNFLIAGEQYFPAGLLEASVHPLLGQLSGKEKDVLRGLSRGQTNKEIARDSDLSEASVKMHLRTICRKIGARNRTQAALIAKEAGGL